MQKIYKIFFLLNYRKTPILVPKFSFFSKVLPGTKCSTKIFQKFFRSKKKVFGPVQIPKKKKNFLGT
jgi:hypothetical protein